MSSAELPDPRPEVRLVDGEWKVEGWVCEACGYRGTSEKPRCPACRGTLAPKAFGPHGRVWAGTVLRVPIADREPPIALAYVDFADGPRLLCHVATETGGNAEALPPGTVVVVAGTTAAGDPLIRCVE
jgi:uncharacterized OB-fold protein